MTKQICIINPIARSRADEMEKLKESIAAMGRSDIDISSVNLDSGPVSIESSIDEVLCAPDIIKKAIDAEASGIDAVIIDCLGDPGLDAVREAVSIPVVGPGESAFHLACTLGHKFGVVTVMDRLRQTIEMHALKYGVHSKLGSVKAVEISVVDIHDNLCEIIALEAVSAIREDKVDVIVLGCTGFLGLEHLVKRCIKEKIGIDIPVISPTPAAVLAAANLLDLNLSHSEVAYAVWPKKEVKGFDFMSTGISGKTLRGNF